MLVSMPCVGWFCHWFLRYLLPTESFPWVLSGKLALTKSYPIWNTPTHFSFQFLKTPYCFAGKQQVTNYNIYYLGTKGEKSGCKSPFLRFWRSPSPFKPTIKIWILICCPYSFPTEVVERWLIKYQAHSSRGIMSIILGTTLFTKHWYYKEKFDSDHS